METVVCTTYVMPVTSIQPIKKQRWRHSGQKLDGIDMESP